MSSARLAAPASRACFGRGESRPASGSVPRVTSCPGPLASLATAPRLVRHHSGDIGGRLHAIRTSKLGHGLEARASRLTAASAAVGGEAGVPVVENDGSAKVRPKRILPTDLAPHPASRHLASSD